MSESIQAQLETARKLIKAEKLAEAESAYRTLLEKAAGSDEKAIQAQEQALYELGKLYRDHKTSANAIYTDPITQANLDNLSGILQAEDQDYKTAFSYFYEAFEGYAGQEDPRANTALKYVLLSKIMLNLSDDIESLLTNKSVIKYAGRDIDAMKAIAKAYSNRSLKEFENTLEVYGKELSSDQFIRSHFSALYDTLLEQNLVKVIEPFSCVEISHIAEIIGLDARQVEGKLSQMILDKVFYGVLDQGNGWLFVYDEPKTDATYDAALDTVRHMSNVVDLLYEKASALN